MSETTTDLHSVKADPADEPERQPTLSIMPASSRGPFRCEPVDTDDGREPGERRIRIIVGDATLFIERRDVGALVTALLTAATR